MKHIAFVDSNFKVKTKLDKKDIKFYDVKNAPFEVSGVFFESGKFRRLPENVAKSVSDGVYALHTHTAGGRVRFRTDSSYVAIHTKMPDVGKMPHFALTGSAGFDLYVGNESQKYMNTFIPPYDISKGYESVIEFDSAVMRDITINFPLYSAVSELFIGLGEDATVLEPAPYRIDKPVVFYGSSITQGGCASRPGNSYESIVSRRLNADFVNLGFSGNAKGEKEIAEYIKSLEMSAFVYDYDYNAPTTEHLKETHENMFQIIRKANPELPVVILSRPKFTLNDEENERLEIIRATYQNAVGSGDKNVYLIDGKTLMNIAGDDGTVDGCHPNDMGFMSMAKAVGDILEKILCKG